MNVKRGDVFFADLSPVVGSEQGGTRPVLIIQNDIGNRFSPTVIIAAITAQIQKAKLPTHVEIDAKKYVLKNRTIIEDLKENSIFGSIISSISNTEYDVLAKEDAQIVIIDFNEIINYNEVNTKYFNQFLKNLLKIISQKIQENNERIEILTNKTIRDKLLAYFKNNTKNSNNRIVYLPFTLTDLAVYLAVNRSAMSRELKNLTDEGFIEIKNKKIKLLFDADIN